MRATSITLTALALLAMLGQSALCEQVWQEQQITNTPYFETSPKIWGQTVYYSDFQSGNGADVYSWTQSGGFTPLVVKPGSQTVQAAHEGSVVYRDRDTSGSISSSPDLYIWDSVNGSRLVSNAPGDQTNADLYGQTVVWEDYRSGDSRVYIWDPVNGERRITSAESHQVNPQIWNGQVVYEDWRQGQPGIYMWSKSEGERFIGYGVSPAIHEGKVVAWELARDIPQDFIPGHLWEWTTEGGYRELSETSQTTRPYYMNLWGDLVAWSASGPGNIAAWHPHYGMMRVNQNGYGNAFAPSLFENRIAWVSTDYNLYVSTFVPEPSSLLALGGCMCALMTYASRRRKRV